MADFPEPVWPVKSQGVDTQPANSMCFIKDPYVLTGYFVQFVRAHFGDSRNVFNPDLVGYMWNADDTLSKILIEPAFKHKVTNTQQRPAVLVRRGPVQPFYPGFGDGQHTSHFESNGSHVGVDFTAIVKGTHILECIGQSGGEAEAIGWEMFKTLSGYKLVLKKDANLGKFIVSEVSPVQKWDENKESWIVTVNLTWAYSFDWTLVQEAPILKKIGLDSVVN
jgi:hypothetical protein